MTDKTNENKVEIMGGTLDVEVICPKCGDIDRRTIDHRIVEISAISCVKCGEFFNAKVQNVFDAGYDHAAAELRWIPVSDPSELPKGKLYLITLANGTVCDSSGFTGFIPQVTAWMPLPKPYTEPADKTAEVGEREGVMNHQYEGQLEEPDDDWFDDEEGSYCDACDEFGMYVICVDDLCHSGSGCIHGDGEILCPHCKGKGKL